MMDESMVTYIKDVLNAKAVLIERGVVYLMIGRYVYGYYEHTTSPIKISEYRV